ncbi:unnamed protein product [Pleuronectes platessa]|uniref:Uncharacterized protein n=1 Tax=Pleuronectes platessa TaxID=8262 RepID=A0A9N7ZAH6_PLEPL|nr:unnamed protein product [Pleuronectes platessa]
MQIQVAPHCCPVRPTLTPFVPWEEEEHWEHWRGTSSSIHIPSRLRRKFLNSSVWKLRSESPLVRGGAAGGRGEDPHEIHPHPASAQIPHTCALMEAVSSSRGKHDFNLES